MLIFLLNLFFILSSILFYFNKKLICLLNLELAMILIMFFSFLFYSNNSNSSFLGSMIQIVFMVLDSVFGLSILISCTRNSNLTVSSYKSF